MHRLLMAEKAAAGSTLNTGIAAFWDLDDVNDSVGSNTLTNNGSVSFANAGPGSVNCATFNGTNYLKILDNAAISNNSSITVAGWWYSPDADNSGAVNQRIIHKYGGTGDEWRIYVESGSIKCNVHGVSAGSSDVAVTISSPPLTDNTWYSIIMVFDASAQTLQIWINNNTTSGPVSYTSGLQDSNSPLTIGSDDIGTTNVINGTRMGCWGYWKKAFTSAERTEFHNGGTAKRYPF